MVKSVRSSRNAIKLVGLDYIRECISYDTDTGEFYCKERPRGHFETESAWRKWANDQAHQSPNDNQPYNGYHSVSLRKEGVVYLIRLTHLAWVLAVGDIPKRQDVKQVDRPTDFSIRNLTLCDKSEVRKTDPVPDMTRSVEAINTLGMDYIKECVDINTDTGVITWKERPRSHFHSDKSYHIHLRNHAGNRAGAIAGGKHRVIRIRTLSGNYGIYAHYLVWYAAGRTVPEGKIIDHINRQKDDNRLVNLRPCTQAENVKNRSLPKNNTTGVMGVAKEGKKWRAFIGLGIFDTIEEAAAIRIKAELQYYGEFSPHYIPTSGDYCI